MTGSMASRKSNMPEANKMARMLRSGRTASELAERYGVNSTQIMQQLTANGWDCSTGAWVGGDKKDYVGGICLATRGGGPGVSGHYVGGGDNPNVVSTVARPFTQRPKPTGFDWPARENTPVVVPPKRRTVTSSGTWSRTRVSKISPAQEVELARRYLEDQESSVTLGHEYGVNERTIRKHLRDAGVPLRSRAEAQRLRHERDRIANAMKEVA